MPRLFVYGTLMRAGCNHGLLGGAPFEGEVCTARGFSLVDLGAYPGMICGGEGTVEGELFEVDRTVLARLDRFEGHPHLFRRSRVGLAGGGEAFAYVLDGAHAEGLPGIPADSEGAARWVPSSE